MAKKPLSKRERADKETAEGFRALKATLSSLEATLKTLRIQARELERKAGESAYQNRAQGASPSESDD